MLNEIKSLKKKKTSVAEVPGLNPSSPAMILMRCRIIVNKVENLRVERETYPWGKKRSNKKKKNLNPDPDLGVFWIRIQIFDRRSGFHEYGSETLNNIILNILQKLI